MIGYLQSTKAKLPTIVYFIYCWAYELTSVDFCKCECGLSKVIVVDWNNYIREVCVWKLPGCIVEIDESLFVRRKNNASRILSQQWVCGGICRDSNECFVLCVPDRSEKTFLLIIYDRVRVGSTILSDSWRAYNNTKQIGDYNHSTVNHKYNFVDPLSGVHTRNVVRMWGSAKWETRNEERPRETSSIHI